DRALTPKAAGPNGARFHCWVKNVSLGGSIHAVNVAFGSAYTTFGFADNAITRFCGVQPAGTRTTQIERLITAVQVRPIARIRRDWDVTVRTGLNLTSTVSGVAPVCACTGATVATIQVRASTNKENNRF